MNVVFLVAHYYPYRDPTTNVAKRCIDYFSSNGNDVTVISMGSNESPYLFEDGPIHVISLKNEKDLSEKKKKNFLGSILVKIRHALVFPHGFKWYYEDAYSTLNEIEKRKKIDVVISVSAPYASLITAIRWKEAHSNGKIIAYIIDPYRFSSRIDYLINSKKYYNYERKIIDKCDYVLLFDTISSLEAQYKRVSVLHTIISPRVVSPCYKDTIELVYAGGFYYNFRNPEYMLQVISLIEMDCLNFHLFTNGSCPDIVEPFYKNKRFIDEGWVDKTTLNQSLSDYDFLVNISNGIRGFQPSKIYEYISTGMPIISFFTNGLREDLLDRYPLSIQIDCDNTTYSEAAKKITEFISDNKDKRVSESVLREVFSDHMVEHFNDSLSFVVNSLWSE